MIIDKRKRIIESAMEEFVNKGFNNASTITIAKRAQVSKGLIFHYFGNKEKLYLFLVKYSLEIMINDYANKIEYKSNDIMERLKEVLIYKIKIMDENPPLLEFITSAYYDSNDETYNELIKSRDDLSKDIYEKLFNNIDYSLFKEGVDFQDALKVIQWTFDGAGKEYMEVARANNMKFDTKDIELIFNKYVSILRKGFYKEENHD